jgi:hypothetical protein
LFEGKQRYRMPCGYPGKRHPKLSWVQKHTWAVLAPMASARDTSLAKTAAVDAIRTMVVSLMP